MADDTCEVALALENMLLPEEVCSYRFEFGEDHSDRPAVWVRVVLRDGILEDDTSFLRVTDASQREVFRIIRENEFDRYPYLQFLTETDQKRQAERQGRVVARKTTLIP